jgi:hypothetical protein
MAPKPKKKTTTKKPPLIGDRPIGYIPPKPKPYTPSPTANNPDSFADSAYKAQLAALEKALSNYRAQMQLQKDRIGIDYAQAERDIGRQRDRDLTNIQEDYAARGIVRSGVYGKRVDDYSTEYNNQLANLARARDRGIQDLDVGYANYNDEWGLNKGNATDAAIQRRLQQIKAGRYTTQKPTPIKPIGSKKPATIKPKTPAKINVIHGSY